MTVSRRPSARSSLNVQRFRTIALPASLAIAAIVLWEVIVRVRDIPVGLLPAPSAVFQRLVMHFPALVAQAIPTTLETIAGFLISAILGIALAVLICASRLAREMLYPNIVVFQLIPKIALAPLFVVWLGIGSESRITFSVFISFFPVVVATLAGLLSVDRDLLRLCRAVGASGRATYLQVRFPAAVPQIFSGLKIAITFSMIGVIVGEFITAQVGLGYMIMFAASQADMGLILAAITMLCVIGLALYGLVVLAERLALKRYGE
jgi:NitT/TauT family transport system permease protein